MVDQSDWILREWVSFFSTFDEQHNVQKQPEGRSRKDITWDITESWSNPFLCSYPSYACVAVAHNDGVQTRALIKT